MTRDEAIEILSCYYEVGNTKQNDAMDMAIEALKAQDAGDMISRQAAIEAIQDEVEPFAIVEPGTTYVVGAGVKDEDVIRVLEQLPSAQPEQKMGKWIESNNDQWLCSNCGQRCLETVMLEPRWRYCPTCGYQMVDEGEQE